MSASKRKPTAEQDPDSIGVPPGTFSHDLLGMFEHTMNSTVREAVHVTDHLDSGDVQAALDALVQIRLNASAVEERIEQVMKK